MVKDREVLMVPVTEPDREADSEAVSHMLGLGLMEMLEVGLPVAVGQKEEVPLELELAFREAVPLPQELREEVLELLGHWLTLPEREAD